MAELDIDFVRAQFPAFAEPSLAGVAHFENAGGSYACGAVIERLNRFYRMRKMQPYGATEPSRAGGAEMDEARERMAALLGVARTKCISAPRPARTPMCSHRRSARCWRPATRSW
jgi:selenocysteine lyase/cysteine desulfurase